MKFFVPLSIFAVAVTAQTTASKSGCDADFILTRCLETETPKAQACNPTDYECLCAAYNAIATCYNNCPNDARLAPAKNQVDVYCRQASLQNTKTTSVAASTTAASATTTSASASSGAQSSGTATSTGKSTETGAAAGLAANSGTMLFGLAGIFAALL
ncbi:hypothetical protein V2G26_008612 [Clonostachys chloroleuca]|uniref:GPI anchored serine-threonine rich protein n=1 Tax=Clonostachys chloroleuca TaxID=1926264 RepID=A0AA35VN12_9HYPO|nr:unnamed protein product [Clonostachys chloroleuca]